jgi:ubiquitin-activating enzyme E1
MVASITKGEKTLVTCLEDTRHNLSTGDVVSFSAVSGMEELNGMEVPVEVKDPWSFEIDVNSLRFGKYTHGGYITEVKQPKKLAFRSLRETIEDPGMFVCDYMKFDTVPVLHLAWRTLHEYRKQHGSLPEPGGQETAERFASLATSINDNSPNTCKVELGENSAKILKNVARTARGIVSPICAVLGGIVGQEVLKACSGKFMPIVQWFHFDAMEALPDEPLPAEQVQPVGSRYDGQIMVFGRDIQDMLGRLNYFLVGAGAIGCEMLKNWAMMGVACGGGKVHVTDMDRIERSNLSRQFLFRTHDINHPKSLTAARAAMEMNKSFRTVAYEQKVAPDTEHLFNDDFYESLDAVCTALDNVEARLYVDQRCLFYHLPMLESGTLGTKGNTQIVVPRLTENYGATRDPPEKGIPICTLKHFPNQIEHTLQWAREWFEETFKQTPEDVNRYLLSTRQEFNASLANQQNMKMEVLKRVKDALTTSRPANFEDCVTWARLQFQQLFVNNIKQLLHNYPLDKMTSSGAPFWSGAKKPPVPIEFDVDDPTHLEFVVSVACMRATVYGLNTPEDVEGVVRRHLPCVVVPAFVPQEGLKIAATDEEAKNENQPITSMDIDRQCAALLDETPSPSSLAGFILQPVEFDKDVDDHMHVVASCANLRAMNYKIPTADLHTARGIAGKIIPAIATTTAMVTGFICLEIYKLLQKKPLEAYRNFFANLALPVFTTSEPNPPATTKAVVNGQEWKFSVWDR